MIILIILGAAFILAKVLTDMVDYHFDHRKWPQIKFADFKKFYALNSDRWILGGDYVECKLCGNKLEGFEFSFIDFYKYKRWKRKLDDHERNADNIESLQRMMDAVKEDIAKAKEKETTNTIDLFVKELDDIPSLLKTLEEHGIHVNIKE